MQNRYEIPAICPPFQDDVLRQVLALAGFRRTLVDGFRPRVANLPRSRRVGRAVRYLRASAASDQIKGEAARMEGEIFLIQSGAEAARPHFEEAKRLFAGKDPFIDERLKAISEKEKR
jgi:hypothetical protein